MSIQQKEIFEQMVKKAAKLPVQDLEDYLLKDARNPSDEDDSVMIFEAMLNALELKLEEKEFMAFCDKINELY